MTALKWQVDAGRSPTQSVGAPAWGWPDTPGGGLQEGEGGHGARARASAPTSMTGVRPLRETTRWRLRRSSPAHPLRCALVYTGLPLLLLVTYVSLWTAAMHYGYRKQQLGDAIAQLRIDNDVLQAKVREAQSSRNIAPRAVALGMERADPEFVVVSPGGEAGRREETAAFGALAARGARFAAPTAPRAWGQAPSSPPSGAASRDAGVPARAFDATTLRAVPAYGSSSGGARSASAPKAL